MSTCTREDFQRHVQAAGLEFPITSGDFTRLAREAGFLHEPTPTSEPTEQDIAGAAELERLGDALREARTAFVRVEEEAVRKLAGRYVWRQGRIAVDREKADPKLVARLEAAADAVEAANIAYRAALKASRRRQRSERGGIVGAIARLAG